MKTKQQHSADYRWFDCMHQADNHAWGIVKSHDGLAGRSKPERAAAIKEAEETLQEVWQKTFQTRARDLQAIRMKIDIAEHAMATKRGIPKEAASVFADFRAYLDSHPRGPRVVPDDVWGMVGRLEPTLGSLKGFYDTLSDLTAREAPSQEAALWMLSMLGDIAQRLFSQWSELRMNCDLVPIETYHAKAFEKLPKLAKTPAA